VTRALTSLALVLAVLVAGCGDNSDKPTIPRDNADKLIALLKDAQVAAGDQDRCDRLERLVGEIQIEVRRLPSSVASDTRETIVDGVNTLEDQSRSECANVDTQTTESTETTPPTTTETVAPTTTETVPPTTTETAPPTTTETQPPTETEPPPTVPNGGTPPSATPGNGNGNGNGNGPSAAPGQEKKGGKKPKKEKPGKGPKGHGGGHD
jgi:hypothetical protein